MGLEPAQRVENGARELEYSRAIRCSGTELILFGVIYQVMERMSPGWRLPGFVRP